MPTDARIEHRCTGPLDGAGELRDLGPVLSLRHEVDERDAVDEDEIFADRFAHPRDDLHRQLHALLVGAAPTIVALIGVRHQELVDEVPLGPHHLDAVVPRLARERRAAHEGADLALDPRGTQRAGRERRDRRTDARGRHQQRLVAVAPAVEDLQRDAPAFAVHGLGDDAVIARRAMRGEPRSEGRKPALDVRREPARDHEPHTAPRTLGEIGRKTREVRDLILKPGVHGAHQYAVGQRHAGKGDGRKQVWVGHSGLQQRTARRGYPEA